MAVLSNNLEAYLTHLAGPESPLLAEVEAFTQAQFASGIQMLSGRYQGRLLAWISTLLQPRHILEIGTFTGYSALCLAEGLQPGGELHTLDRDARLVEPVQGFFAKSAWASQMHIHIGPAADTIGRLEGPFDLVFIDADKRAYDQYLEAVTPLCRSGAVILLDNVLWKGKVYEENTPSEVGLYIQALNTKIAADSRWRSIMLPVRDGLWALQVR
jgi:predicted O-methyltransferase YrrM